MICFWNTANTISTGMTARLLAAMIRPHWVPASPEKSATPTGSVRSSGFWITISGQRKAL